MIWVKFWPRPLCLLLSARRVLAEFPDLLSQLEAVKDSPGLGLELFWWHGALQLAPEQHHVLHEQSHGLLDADRQLGHGAGAEAQVDASATAQAFSTLLYPGQGSVQNKHIHYQSKV